MNKEKFIKELSKKLSILNEEERNDIINEYIDMIDEKVKHGKTEEEAVKDFGNLDDLAKEIISTYKVNPNYHKNETFSNVEKVISDGAKKLTDFTNDIIDNVKEGDLNLQKIFEIAISIFILLIVFAVLRVPFFVISEIGEAFIDSTEIFGFSVLGGIWKALSYVLYYGICILLLVTFIKRYNPKEDKKIDTKENNSNKTKAEGKKKASISNKKQTRVSKSNSVAETLSTIILLFVKIWVCILFLCPLLMIDIALVIALCVTIYLIIKGVTFYGILILLMGCLIIAGYLSKIIFNGLFKNKKIYLYPFVIGFILVVLGGLFTFDYFADFTVYKTVPDDYVLETKTYMINVTEKTFINQNSEYQIDNNLKDNQVRIEVSYYPDAMELNDKYITYRCEEGNCLNIIHDVKEKESFRLGDIFEEHIIQTLKKKEVYDYNHLTDLDVTVYVNENTKDLVWN